MQHSATRVQEINPGCLIYLSRKQFALSKAQKGNANFSDIVARRECIQFTFAAAEEFNTDIHEMSVYSIRGRIKLREPTIGQCKEKLNWRSCATRDDPARPRR